MDKIDQSRIAVALHYDKEKGDAPKVTAKGRGAVAEKIIAMAEENDVVIQGNPILAEALSNVELDTQIPEDLYKAVAEVISFVLRHSGRR